MNNEVQTELDIETPIKKLSYTHTKRLSRFRRSISDANKIALLFQYWWNTIFDNNPIYCFGCGDYIPVHKRNPDYFQRPYKKEPIHNICWDSLHPDRFVKRLDPESNLICHMDLGWGVHGSVCRKIVKNNAFSIMVHMINHHGWRTIPELVQKDLDVKMKQLADSKVSDKEFSKKLDSEQIKITNSYKNNPEKWFNDNELIWDNFRSIHFLKPNGRYFPKVRDY